MKLYLDSIGCRLNQAEIEALAARFAAAGHTLVSRAGDADLVVVNTCAVTAEAASDSRQKIRQASRAGAGQVAVTGCWSTLAPDEAAALPGVARVIPNAHKDQLFELIGGEPEHEFDREPVTRRPVPGARLRTRAFLKAQDGCDNRCTFCVTTLARGASRSRPAAEVVADAQSAVAGGAQEIVLTGVHLGSWGRDLPAPQSLAALVRALLDDTAVPRLRLSSLEPWDLDEAFFTLWSSPRLCPQLHLPLQAGAAAVLRRMARKTSPPAFRALVQAARQAIPGVAITTDLIAGFPGETDAEFAEGLDFVTEMAFAGGHVFTYSARAGTAAARMPGQVPGPLRKQRGAALRAVLAESQARYQRQHLGDTVDVLWESAHGLGPGGWQLSGLTGNYLRVVAQAPRSLWNQVTPVVLESIEGDALRGRLLAPAG